MPDHSQKNTSRKPFIPCVVWNYMKLFKVDNFIIKLDQIYQISPWYLKVTTSTKFINYNQHCLYTAFSKKDGKILNFHYCLGSGATEEQLVWLYCSKHKMTYSNFKIIQKLRYKECQTTLISIWYKTSWPPYFTKLWNGKRTKDRFPRVNKIGKNQQKSWRRRRKKFHWRFEGRTWP